jgi:hypothetical protein
MRLTDLLDKEHSFRYLIGLGLALIFFLAVWVPSRSLAAFYANLDGLSESVERSDFTGAEGQLAEVSAFYEGSRVWGMQWFADSYLFQDAFLQLWTSWPTRSMTLGRRTCWRTRNSCWPVNAIGR